MDTMTSATDSGTSMLDPAVQYPDRSPTESCAVMTVAWLTREADAFQQQGSAGIQILIPGEQTAFHLVYRTVDGREQRTFVRGPHVAIMPAQHPYALDCERHPDVVVITLDQAFFEQKARAVLGREAPRLVAQYSAADPFVRELGNTLRNELQMLKVPSAAYLECVAAVVAIHLARRYTADHASVHGYNGLAPHKLKRVQSFIADHFAEPVRLAQLAQIVHMSPFHFARMFKKATGKPPHVYITAQRMEHAKALLRDSELPLVDVAASVGFQTQGHFTGVFRRYSGVTPRIFRLNCQAARFQREPGAQDGTPQDCVVGAHAALAVGNTGEAQDSYTAAQRPERSTGDARLS
jgi:AraC family transcriptional regulator